MNAFMSSEEEDMIIKPNALVCGDNEKWLNDVPDESVDLCYIDPPFFSNKNYEVIWGNGYEIRSFGDRFGGDIKHYIEWMRPRIELIHKKLKPTGSIFLHCDWHASHRLRVLLDDIFKPQNFRNEIIWHYEFRLMDSDNQLNRKHDNILFYAKSSAMKINMPKTEWTRDEIIACRKQKIYQNSDGREWVWMPGGKGNSKNKKKFLDEIIKEGKASSDVWQMLPLTSSSKERLGYPTQKPEALVKKVIEMASSEGDTVLDCFSGGGTTAKVCADLKRQFIVGDVSPVATKITAERLNFDCSQTKYKIYNLPRTVDQFKQLDGYEFEKMICELKGWEKGAGRNDGGIDGWDGNGDPIQIKNHSTASAGRPDLQKFASAIRDKRKKRGVFIAWSFARNAKEYAAEVKQDQGIDIVLMPCSEVFGDLVIPHEKEAELKKLYNERYPEIWNQRQRGASSTDSEEAHKRAAKRAREGKEGVREQRKKRASTA